MTGKHHDFNATPEAPVRTNWRVLIAFLVAGFGCGGTYWEMRALRKEVDKLASQREEELRQRISMQQDVRELSRLVKGSFPQPDNRKVSRLDGN